MISINNNTYKLCLFDTNALSDFLKNPKQWITYFDNEFSLSNTIICYSIFSLSELYYRHDLFEKYLEFFSVFPSAILDGYNSIYQKELKNYFSNDIIDPIVLVPSNISGKLTTSKVQLLEIIKKSGFINKTEYWKSSQEEILNGILSLIKNFPPRKKNYSINEIEEFNFIVSTQQIGLRSMDFATEILKNKEHIELNKFPSVISMNYTVFYKFYLDNRKPLLSDIFDIIISSLLPYVDYVITEGNMCEIIKTIKKRHNFLLNIDEKSIKDLNNKIRYYD